MKMSSNQNLHQPRSNRNRANPRPLDISYSNIRGLRTNFAAVQSFLSTKSPDILALCETGLDESISDRDFDVPGYSTLITKHDHHNRHLHGLGVYIKDGLPAPVILPMKILTPHTCAFVWPFSTQPLICFFSIVLKQRVPVFLIPSQKNRQHSNSSPIS